MGYEGSVNASSFGRLAEVETSKGLDEFGRLLPYAALEQTGHRSRDSVF